MLLPMTDLFNIASNKQFEELALKVFNFQAKNNAVYKEYLSHLRVKPSKINSLTEIPFLPISFFRTHELICSQLKPELIFGSSGTTSAHQSTHFVANAELYINSFRKGFEHFYGDIKDYCLLALLPSYLERKDSSLVYMVGQLIKDSRHPKSAFFLNDLSGLAKLLEELMQQNQQVLLLGLSSALLDLSEKFPMKLINTTVMETGGMKGKRKELVKEELHELLCNGLGVAKIHSEYGMTELLSQAYSKGNGLFKTPPWMKILIRDTNDPFTYVTVNKSGGINIIDLANYYSCSFIATQDLGKLHPDGSFEVLGRFDNSDLRGCNLMLG